MAESALSLGYADIASTVSRAGLGYTSTIANLGTQELADVQSAIDKGYRDFLKAYDWSFLRKFRTVVTNAPYTTGTITLTNGSTTVTLVGGTWPTWAAQGMIYYGGTEYEIDSRTDDTNVELLDSWTNTTASAVSYECRRLAYTLPDDFGTMRDWFSYATEYGRPQITRIGYEELRQRRTGKISTGYPLDAALRPKTDDYDGTAGQRWEVCFLPLADQAYTLGYTYYILASTQLRTATPYPVGGMTHSETIRDCCVLAAKHLFRDMPLDEYKTKTQIACADSIVIDKRNAPAILGYCPDGSDGLATGRMWTDDEGRYVTVDGSIPT